MSHISKFIWLLIGAAVTAVATIVVAYVTAKTPVLVYDSFPPAQVATAATNVSIYNVRVDNVGSKEAINVSVYLALPAESDIVDVQVKPRLASIEYQTTPKGSNAYQIVFPMLNASEGSQFSLLVRQRVAEPLTVEVRGNGVSGHERRSEETASVVTLTVKWLTALASVILGVLASLGAYLKLRDSRLFVQRMFSQQLRVFRTRVGPPSNAQVDESQLKTLLATTTFRFFFNPSLSLDKSKLMRFDADGTILEGFNKKETSWRVRNGLFEFITEKGRVNSRFYYSPNDRCFYQIPDQDTSAVSIDGIGDQYMMAVTGPLPAI